MAVLTRLPVAAKGLGPRLVVIRSMATLIVFGPFNRVVISASERFTAMLLGRPISVGDWPAATFLPALVGNVVGGGVFVTLLHDPEARVGEER